MSNPFFSVIVPHYDGAISDETFVEGMQSIASSNFDDYEVLIYHDGPTSRPIPDLDQFGFKYKYKETKKRYNNWGHSLRDLGIREASGEYIIHFNPDNILNENAMTSINKSILLAKEWSTSGTDMWYQQGQSFYEVCISPIIMEGVVRGPAGSMKRSGKVEDRLLMDGIPPQFHNVDCMQAVASKKAWLSIGGWYNKQEQSDGMLIEHLVRENSFCYSPQIIGVHR
jgi:hypothetical protein